MSIEKHKISFAEKQIIELSISGAFQHNRIYLKGVNPKERMRFRKYLSKELKRSISKIYHSDMREDVICLEIKSLSQKMSRRTEISKFTIGTSQKLINLMLKYNWVFDIGSIPPHCPIDRTILLSCGITAKWTAIDTIEKYEELIDQIKAKAKGTPIAIWELKKWNKIKKY